MKIYFWFIVLMSGFLGGMTQAQQPAVSDGGGKALHLWAFQDKAFVDNLTLSDVELVAGGAPVTLDGLYLVRGGRIVRREEKTVASPSLARDYYLLFQVYDYDTKYEKAIEYFLTQVVGANDSLTLMTPLNTYRLLPAHLAQKPRKVLAEEMYKLVRKDIQTGASFYRTLLRELRAIVRFISGSQNTDNMELESDDSGSGVSDMGLEVNLERYRDALSKMESLRIADENKIMNFAALLKQHRGLQSVFFFYQKEFRPEYLVGNAQQPRYE